MGNPTSAASSAAVYAPRGSSSSLGMVCLPSDSSTIAAGGGPSGPWICSPNWRIADCAAAIASPVAVALCRIAPSRARATVAWSVVGITGVCARPAKVTSPTLRSSGSESMNSRPACFAVDKRSGWTSVADIDKDTSTTSMIVARLRATFVSAIGPAKAMASTASAASSAATGKCRSHGRSRPETSATMEKLPKAKDRRRRRWSTYTYAAAASTGTSRASSQPGWANAPVIGHLPAPAPSGGRSPSPSRGPCAAR